MSYQEFKNKFTCKQAFFKYQVVSAIPKHLATKTKNAVVSESEPYIENNPLFQLDEFAEINLGKAKNRD